MLKKQNLLYIHGFNSSPQSVKAQEMQTYIQKNHAHVTFHCPQLKNTPNEAIKQLTDIIDDNPKGNWSVIGSSLGGYFSTYLAEKYQIKAVLVNPAVKPFELLMEYLGEQKNPYTHEVFSVTKAFITDLKSLEQKNIFKKHYMVMVQTGDEVLDYQQAADKYKNCQLIIEQGGDHSFVEFDRKLPEIARFLSL